jgi:drug/metabolite transporter (DMT)-like permease
MVLSVLLWISAGWAVWPVLFRGVANAWPTTRVVDDAHRKNFHLLFATYALAFVACCAAVVLVNWRALREEGRAAGRLVAPSTWAMLVAAAAVSVFCNYYFISTYFRKESTTTTLVVLVTYCLPVLAVAVLSCVLYGERFTAVGYVSGLATLACIYVFVTYGIVRE